MEAAIRPHKAWDHLVQLEVLLSDPIALVIGEYWVDELFMTIVVDPTTFTASTLV
jgi:hypothetical protein